MELNTILKDLGVDLGQWQGNALTASSPRDGAELARLAVDSPADATRKIDEAHEAFLQWRLVPAPQRGELVRLLGNVLRENKAALGRLVTLEAGKITSEGLGEVQEMIDICDFAVGLSRQLYGLTIASERPGHRMMETWHPLGVCGVISAFKPKSSSPPKCTAFWCHRSRRHSVRGNFTGALRRAAKSAET